MKCLCFPSFSFWMLLLLAPVLARAQGTYTAASCSYADVNACVNSGSASTCSPGGKHTVVNGDVVVIPAGTCTWASTLTGPSGVGFTLIGTGTPNSGSGTTGAATPQTFIIDNAGSGSNDYMMQFSPSYGAPTMRVSMMSIDPVGASTSLADPIFFLGSCTSSGCPNVRVDNISFGYNTQWSESGNSSNAEAGVLAEMVFGVLDHNTLCTSAQPCPGSTGWELFNAEQGVYLGTGQYGDNSWAQPDSLGTANNIFAENNQIYSNGYLSMNDCEQDDAFENRGGCRFVIRYNTFTVTGNGGFGLAQNHGTDSGGRARGGRNAEVYGNTYNCGVSSGGCSGLEGGLRSGTALYFNNTFTFSAGAAGSSSALGLSLYRAEASWGSPFSYCGGGSNAQSVTTYDQVDGTTYFSGAMSTSGSGVLTMTDSSQSFGNLVPSGAPYSVFDVTQNFYSEVSSNTSNTITIHGNIGGGSAAWTGFNNGDSYQVLRATVCADQPARGKGIYISGTTPSPTGWVEEALDPIYRWAETFPGGTPSQSKIFSSVSGRLIAYRDWYDQASGIQTTSSSPFSCNGSTGGVGWGTLSNRPSSCSGACSANSPGCGYFATDQGSQGTLYAWESGAWISYYQAYTYPHPLDGGTPETGAPSPPTGLTVTVVTN